MQSWAGRRCQERDVVREDEDYGPPDHICRQHVTFVRKCGHENKLPCAEAFRFAADGASPCLEKVGTINPFCGHQCSLRCHEKALLLSQPVTCMSPLLEAAEGELVSIPSDMPRAVHDCKTEILLHRRCGHTLKISCGQARKVRDWSLPYPPTHSPVHLRPCPLSLVPFPWSSSLFAFPSSPFSQIPIPSLSCLFPIAGWPLACRSFRSAWR